jgi:hypothetical protein
MLRNDIIDFEYLEVIRPARQISLRKLVEPELRYMIRDLRVAWMQWKLESARTMTSVRSDYSDFV